MLEVETMTNTTVTSFAENEKMRNSVSSSSLFSSNAVFMAPIVYHKAGLPYVYGSGHGSVTVVFLTSSHQQFSDVHIVWGDNTLITSGEEWRIAKTPMITSGCDGSFRYWKAQIVPEFRRLRYYFEFCLPASSSCEGGGGGEKKVLFRLCEKGMFSHQRFPEVNDSFSLPYVCWEDDLQPPAWSKKAIWYQIFPERFQNGDPSLSPEEALEWGSEEPSRTNFFGGDLKGIHQKLPYLKDLGVNGLYLTPIFVAPTNHKYDTVDYFSIDPHFGTADVFKNLVDQAHNQGMKVMLDAVMNHLGSEHPFFKDLIHNGRQSKYWDWFFCKEDPFSANGLGFRYETFAFESHMPKLNTRNPKVRNYLTEVGRYWIDEFNIDGWRLDVANEIDHKFWRHFRQNIEFKKTNTPSNSIKEYKSCNNVEEEEEEHDRVFLLGEVWHDALPWLDGSQFHSVMNYPLYAAIMKFFAEDLIDTTSFKNEIVRILHLYPSQILSAMFNIIGSHDTPRALTVAKGNVSKLRLMFLFQFAFPGVPSIYYGDELAMEGGLDPGCRRCMEWNPNEKQLKMKTFVKRLISARKDEPAFGSVNFTFLDLKAKIDGSSPICPEPKNANNNNNVASLRQRDVVCFKKSEKSFTNSDPNKMDEGDLLFILNNGPAPLSVTLDSSLLSSSCSESCHLTHLQLQSPKKHPTSILASQLPTDLTVKPFNFIVLRMDP
jgi:glycosidase